MPVTVARPVAARVATRRVATTRVAVLRFTAVLMLGVVVLAGCGKSDPTRQRIASYLGAVNRIESRLVVPLRTVNTITRQVTYHVAHPHARAQPAAGQERALATAATAIRADIAKIRALPAPAPAAQLKSLVISLAQRQLALTVQMRELIAFLPAFPRALRPLGPAVVKLEHVLSIGSASGAAAVSRVYAEKAAALRTFAATLGRALRGLATLVPPDSSRPAYLAEQRALRRMRAAAITLASDLGAGRTAGVSTVINSFDAAAALPGARSVQVAEIAAVRAYDAQVSGLSTLVNEIDRDRYALGQRYP